MIKVTLSQQEYDLLTKILSNKAKELHGWIAALQTSLRIDEYNEICDLLKTITRNREVV